VILWLDAQLSPALASWISERFTPIQAVPVRELGLRNADDREIFAQARSAGAIVMTKDRDFLHLLFEQGPPPQVIWLRVGNSSNQALQAMLLRTLKEAVASLREGEPWVEIRSPV
jgi:predicted nuclease of predicted toxin-antitoxin system